MRLNNKKRIWKQKINTKLYKTIKVSKEICEYEKCFFCKLSTYKNIRKKIKAVKICEAFVGL